MKSRSLLFLPLGAALLLGAAVALHFLLSEPEPEAAAAWASPVTVAPPATAATAPTNPEPVKAPQAQAPVARVEVTQAGERATVVPIQPGDLVPEPEVENPPPQQNDPIEPEKPQTAAWKHGKMVRMSELLERDVDRLEEERLAAEKRGDGEEAKRLEVQLRRHRARLGKLREETETLAETARQEPGQ
jgi:outer membrane biosynthesis protein TonB